MKIEKQTQVIMTIAEAYTKKNTTLTDKIEKIIFPMEINLPNELKEKLELIKTTPIDEPELQTAFESENTFAFRTTVCKKLDIDVDAYDAATITELTIAVLNKFRDKIDVDGMYKTTPNLVNMKMPKTSQIQDIMDLVAKDEVTNEMFETKIFEIAGINKDILSKWEKELVDGVYNHFVTANNDSFALKQAIDKTPFSRYLKN